MKTNPQTVENQAQAAAMLGVSLEEVRRAKAEGCPAFRASSRIHVPTLRAWFHHRPLPEAAAPKPAPVPLSDSELAQLSTLEASLAMAIREEVEASRMLQHAREVGDSKSLPDLTRAVGIARKNRMVLTQSVREEAERRDHLISADLHILQINRVWFPIITLLRSLPRRMAMKVAPADDVHAEKILADGVEEVIVEARRSLIKPPDVDFHVAVWLAAVLADGGKERALERLDALRAQVIATSENETRRIAPPQASAIELPAVKP